MNRLIIWKEKKQRKKVKYIKWSMEPSNNDLSKVSRDIVTWLLTNTTHHAHDCIIGSVTSCGMTENSNTNNQSKRNKIEPKGHHIKHYREKKITITNMFEQPRYNQAFSNIKLWTQMRIIIPTQTNILVQANPKKIQPNKISSLIFVDQNPVTVIHACMPKK